MARVTGGRSRCRSSSPCLREGYSWSPFASDLVAGVTVGLVALPLAMAFAIASGVPPQNGLYCAVIAGFTISALGGSRVQIGGPTGAFVVVVSGIVAAHGIDGLFMCTLMAGVMLILLGVTGLGTAVKYIPRPVVIGFTNGIGVLIASTQIRDLFGLQTPSGAGRLPRPREGAGRQCRHGLAVPRRCSALATIAGSFCAAAGVSPRFPGSIIVLARGFGGGVRRRAAGRDHRHAIRRRAERAADASPTRAQAGPVLTLLSPALTVAMLGAIESLLSAVVADRMSGDRHDPNVELTAQGIANVLSPLFGGLPATGAIARTATNIRSGARTPVAGMTHAVTLLLVLVFAAPLHAPYPAGDARRHPHRSWRTTWASGARSRTSSSWARRKPRYGASPLR